MIVGPREPYETAAGVPPHGFRDLDTGGVEDSEFSEGGFGVELDDLGVVADDRDWAAEGGAGEFVAAQINVFPFHGVESRFPVVAVAEREPLGGDSDSVGGRHC